MTEQEELAWGKVADQDVQDGLRLYRESPEFEALVQAVGEKIAERSERPAPSPRGPVAGKHALDSTVELGVTL